MIASVAPQDVSNIEPLELTHHNGLIGDRKALDEVWDRNGYWFFRNVLDKEAVRRFRSVFVEELEKLGVINPVGDSPTDRSVTYNGGSLENFPPHMEPVAARRAWRTFVSEPAVHAFFAELLQDEPFWVPVVEHRATPPAKSPPPSRLTGIHQDGPYSPGIPFRICWVPLAEIDADVGGLLFAEGLAEKVNRHPIESDGTNALIPFGDVPADAWRRTTYRAGDLLLMNSWTPHTGVINISDRFRLSVDLRVMGQSEKCPIVGEVVSISLDRIAVRDESGVTHLRLDENTYARSIKGHKVFGAEFLELFAPGASVIVAHENELVSVLRTIHA